MKRRVRVFGSTAVLPLITGGKGQADAGLILNGAMECFELAEQLISAGEKIVENERCPEKKTGPGFYGRKR
jgi:hypothetical protein